MTHSIDLEHELRRLVDVERPDEIELTFHLDNRLPAWFQGDRERFGALIGAAAGWVLEGGAGTSGIAIWRDDADPEHPVQIELVRQPRSGTADHPDALLALAEGFAGRLVGPTHTGTGAERLTIHLPRVRPITSRRVGDAWGGAFAGKRLLMLCDIVFDPARCAASLAAIGIAARFTTERGTAELWARDDGPFDYLMLCRRLLGESTETFRARLQQHCPTARCLVFESRSVPVLGPNDQSSAPQPLDLVFNAILQETGRIAAVREDAGRAEEIPDLSGICILIAEDVVTNHSMLRAILAPTGARLLLAENGIEALRLFRNNRVDLVLMDIQMPQMDGLAAARQIRALDAEARIVALTAYAQERDQELYRRLGMQGYLAKPVHIDELYRLLRTHLPLDKGEG